MVRLSRGGRLNFWPLAAGLQEQAATASSAGKEPVVVSVTEKVKVNSSGAEGRTYEIGNDKLSEKTSPLNLFVPLPSERCVEYRGVQVDRCFSFLQLYFPWCSLLAQVPENQEW